MQSVYVTLDPGRAIVVFDPNRVTPEDLTLAVTTKTPYGAEILEIVNASERPAQSNEPGDCLIWGLFCG